MNRLALITGGTRGIGLGIASALAHEGFDLALCGRRAENEVSGVVRELSARGVTTAYLQADIGKRQNRERLIAWVRERFGRLHVLVNNAGMAPRERRDILEATEESFDEVLGVNLRGPYFLTQAAARWMIEQKSADQSWQGCIITVSSVSATWASVNRGEYCISKAGLAMATRLWAVKLTEYGIPVYEIRPGVITSDMTAKLKEKYDKLIAEGLVPQGRWGTGEDVGRAAAMLARGDLAYSTGQVVMVDGGMSMERL